MKLSVKMNIKALNRRSLAAFTIAEVIVAIAITAVAFSGVIRCYTQCTRRAQWSGYSLAAQAIANKELEQARAAVWDGSQKNELLTPNLTVTSSNSAGVIGYSVATLDLPVNGTNAVVATNFVTISPIPIGNISVYMVRVDTVWPFKFGGSRVYTNSVATYYAPDNRDL